MSIPPLVCSTPPPPDQCEEDKEPDEFGIPYSLSRDDDDDDDEYNYSEFSSYNHYSSNYMSQTNETQSVTQQVGAESMILSDTKEVRNAIESENEPPKCEIPEDNLFGTNTSTDKTKSDEDTNLEDLCLEVIEESLSSNEKEDDKSEIGNDITEDPEKVVEPDISENNSQSSPMVDNVEEISHVDNLKEILDDPVDELPVYLEIDALPSESTSNDEISKSIDVQRDNELKTTESNLDDDFGDYDDFQYISTERKSSNVIENCDNPWDSNQTAENTDFGNFTANFDTVENVTQEPRSESQENTFTQAVKEDLTSKNVVEEDDDFGDFDDFKSSAQDKTGDTNAESNMNIPVLNLQSSDNEPQVMESITSVMISVFEEELTENEMEFEGRIEAMLSETWRHLRETDVRQPYILNWNNSLGQKMLLRALCIDSRNILFGPKWSYNMPKYAVNLSAAPLQPQKPLTPLNPSQTETVANKNPKPGAWTDPFTADGQEFTYAEALLLDLEHLMATLDQMAHSHSTLKISELLSHACSTENESVVEVTATDLDVFEAAISKKCDKIYSSTLNVQPLRQISLPDTHIFTPTDSETPTSKTVHNGPPILLPQTSIDGSKESNTSISNTPDNDDDNWEFQDFKSSSAKSSTTAVPPAVEQDQLNPTVSETKTDALKPNITYQTQVLQPIKMEPLMPTVNWPDPGHIKETFDDFSDFVSNSSWNGKPQSQASITQVEVKKAPEIEVTGNKMIEEKPPVSNTDMDDEFDTFQSALPPKHITAEFNFDSLTTDTFNIPQEPIPDFNAAFPNVKSENISVNSFTSEALKPSVSFPLNTQEITAFKGPVGNTSHSNMLQPSTISSSQSHQKTGQILQPLSLESYSQINWPNPGIDLQDLSRFNPVETLHSLKSDLSVGGTSKGSSPVHGQKNVNMNSQVADDDWGEFVSSMPKQASLPKKPASFVDDDEWTDFVSSPSVKPQNGLNTISLNVHTNSNMQKSSNKLSAKSNQIPVDIPSLNYITPKTGGSVSYNDRHFQNL